jgi:hypothetical protein
MSAGAQPSKRPMRAIGIVRPSMKTPSRVSIREIIRITAMAPQTRSSVTIQKGRRRGSSGANQP